MTEAAQSDGTSLLSTADAVDLLLQTEAPEEDTPEVSEEPPVVEEPEAETVEVEVEAEAEEVEYEEVGDDESEYEDDEEEAPVVEEQLYRVKAGDDEAEVTLDELKNSYMRNADYTRKTQQVAQQRKAAEANLEAVLGEREQAAQIQAESQQRLAHERDRMNEIIPEWLDEKIAAKEKAAVVNYAQRQGYSETELSQVSDARAVSMIRKAYLYDELMSGKPAAQKKTAKAPRMTKSGQPKSGRQISQRRKQDALAKIGTQKGKSAMDAAVNYLLQK